MIYIRPLVNTYCVDFVSINHKDTIEVIPVGAARMGGGFDGVCASIGMSGWHLIFDGVSVASD